MKNAPAISVEQSVCVGCDACIDSCPTDVLRRNDDGKAVAKFPEDCQFCFLCVFDCPTHAISISIPPLADMPRWWPHWTSRS